MNTPQLPVNNLKNLEIIISDRADQVERFAAAELRRHLCKTTMKTGNLTFFIGAAGEQYLPDADSKSKLEHDGFIIHADAEKIIIFGNNPRGTLNGVYSLLDEWGFRWVYPRAAEEIVPDNIDLSLVKGTKIVNPDLEIRGVCVFPVDQKSLEQLRQIIDWMGKNRINLLMTSVQRANRRKLGWAVDWCKVEKDLLPELQKRGIMLNVSEHSGRYFFPISLFDEHPEWFALNAAGERHNKGQICYSNQEAVARLVKNYAEYVREHPEVDIIGAWPEDGYGFCQCADCKQPGTVLKAVNQIADKIAEIRPELTVEYLSYTAETSDVPEDILPRANMAILVANTRVAEEWLKKSRKVGGKGIYQLHYGITDNSAQRACLKLVFEQTRQDCLAAKRVGIRGIVPFYIGIDTWWRASLNLYFLSQFSWDLQKETKDILRDFCEKYFAACPAEAFDLFAALENMPRVDQSIPAPWPLWQEWPQFKTDFSGATWDNTVKAFDKLKALLAKVRNKCGSEPVSQRRCDAVEAFIAAAETMFLAWHERALAVAAFAVRDAQTICRHMKKVAEYEQRMVELHDASLAADLGVNGAWPDFIFFQNWRLQLDKQLMEMNTVDNMRPVTDEDPEMELFIPAMLNN